MNRSAVTPDLLDELVGGSHAEGTTCLAVAVAVEHDDRVLLIAVPDNDFDHTWELPTGLVLPGETLLTAIHRTLTVTTRLHVADVTGYTGHNDRLIHGELVRTFIFNVTTTDPHRICRNANVGHYWTDDTNNWTGPPNDRPAAVTGNKRPLSTSAETLETALRAQAQGVYTAEAAIELLVTHRSWLRRHDFVRNYVAINTNDPTSKANDPPLASVDWPAALRALDTGYLPCSRSEAQLLQIAASLANGHPVDLRQALPGLDTTNTNLVAHAITHAAGHHN